MTNIIEKKKLDKYRKEMYILVEANTCFLKLILHKVFCCDKKGLEALHSYFFSDVAAHYFPHDLVFTL